MLDAFSGVKLRGRTKKAGKNSKFLQFELIICDEAEKQSGPLELYPAGPFVSLF